VPESLVSLVERGIIETVVRPLAGGKEAEVYLVLAQGEQHVAKVYKDADNRSFKHRAEYVEGRRGRNTRDQRAIDKRSQHGKTLQEDAWRSLEAKVIYCLYRAGIRVPEPVAYVDNVLVMELVTDGQGEPAPKLAELRLEKAQAEQMLETLIREVIRMLCAGWVHSDLSEFNILASANGPVIIDFPEAVDSARNRNACKLLIRDVGNLLRFFGRFSPRLRSLRYGEQIWELYDKGQLTPDVDLDVAFEPPDGETELSSLLAEIEATEREYLERREALGLPPPRSARRPRTQVRPSPSTHVKRPSGRSKKHGAKPAGTKKTAQPPHTGSPAVNEKAAPSQRRRRRRRRRRKPGGDKPS